MDNGPPFPFAELYGSAQAARGGPRVVPGVAISAWKTDARALRCGICLKKFTLLRWKHHCRVCGDVCCRRCLGFCLVDVPLLGVDLAFTCARCIRRVAAKPPAFPDIEASGVSYMTIMSSPLSSSSLSSSSSVDQLVPSSPSCPSSPSSAAATPKAATGLTASFNCGSSRDELASSFSSALHQRGAGDRPNRKTPLDVTVSQSRSAKLQSVCALVGDYLECAGAAVVLLSADRHVWVVAHRGLRAHLLHDDAFFALCQRGRDHNASFAQSEPKSRVAGAAPATDTFRFAAVAPLRRWQQLEGDDDAEQEEDGDSDGEPKGEALGCLLALDTRARSDAAALRIRKTLENLARLVMDLLTEEKAILRVFESGDFKMFAASATDLAPAFTSVFLQSGVPSATATATTATATTTTSRSNNSVAATAGRRKRSTPMPLTGGLLSSMVMNRLRRSRSFNCVDCEIAAAAAAAAASSPSPAASPVAASPSSPPPSARPARRAVFQDDGFDIVAHPGMNHGRKHAASGLASGSGRPACTSNCRSGPRRHRRRDESASVASSSASPPTSTAA